MRFLLVLTLSVLSFAATAQPSNIQYSDAFDEPEKGWNKILQLKGGNTFLFNFSKDGIDVTVFNASHIPSAKKTLKSDLWEARKMKNSVIEGLYEISGKPVIFLQQMLDRTPTLFRIVLNPTTGDIEKEDIISELQRYGMGAGYAMAFGKVEAADHFVEKDPASDCYAVINFNSFATESNKRIEMVHYNGNHKEINRAYYDAQGFKFVNIIGTNVDADKRVLLCTYGFNTEASGGKDSRIIVSSIIPGSKTFTHKQIEYTDDFKNTEAIMQYNPGTGMIQLLTLTEAKKQNKAFSGKSVTYFNTMLSFIDPETLQIIGAKIITNEMADAYAKNTLGIEKGFFGLPQNMYINPDNSTTVLSEQMVTTQMISNNMVSYRTELGHAAVSDFDERGTEKNGITIPKDQMANGLIEPLYMHHKTKGFWSLRGPNSTGAGFSMINNNAFLSYDYVATPNGRYVLYNDYPENLEKKNLNKLKQVVYISDANTMAYKINNGKAERFYLFGQPENENDSKFCYIESSHFLKDNNTYATLLVDKKGKKKLSKVAWLKF